MEFPKKLQNGVFIFGLGIFKGSNTVLWNIQGLTFVFSGISRVKVKNKKFQGVSKTHILNHQLPQYNHNFTVTKLKQTLKQDNKQAAI